MGKVRTSLIVQFDTSRPFGVDDDNLESYIFDGDDSSIELIVDTEEHPEFKELTNGKFYMVTVEDYEC